MGGAKGLRSVLVERREAWKSRLPMPLSRVPLSIGKSPPRIGCAFPLPAGSGTLHLPSLPSSLLCSWMHDVISSACGPQLLLHLHFHCVAMNRKTIIEFYLLFLLIFFISTSASSSSSSSPSPFNSSHAARAWSHTRATWNVVHPLFASHQLLPLSITRMTVNPT